MTKMRRIVDYLEYEKFSDVALSSDRVTAESLSAAVESLDLRLSGVDLVDAARPTLADVVRAANAIIRGFSDRY